MHLYFFTAPVDDVNFQNTSVGYFTVVEDYHTYSEAMSICCGIGAIFYTPNSENELITMASELNIIGS